MQLRSASTRQHLLDVASQLFSKYGYDATGVAEICQAAGLSKGAFYHHFPSKQAAFMALLNSYLGGIDSGFTQMRLDIRAVPEALVKMAEMAGSIFQSADIHLPIFLEIWTQAKHDPQVWEATIAPYHRYQAYFAAMIQEGIQAGSIKPVDAQLAGRVLVSLALGMLMQSLFDPSISDWRVEARQSIQILMDGMAGSRE